MTTLPQLKIHFLDYWKPIDEFFIDWLSDRYDVVLDHDQPDYLFFADETFGTQNQTWLKPCKRIFFTGENRRPSNYKCDFSITFDHIDDERNFRLPLYFADYANMWINLGMDQYDSINRMRNWNDKAYEREFCSFVCGNPNCQKRNDLFMQIQAYKQIHSGGPLFNTIGQVIPRGPDAPVHKINLLQQTRFNLCAENGSYPGYVTEKLFHAFYGKTVPIYYGSPTAALDFNPRAFLNWHDYQNDEAFIEKIVEIDSDRNKYMEMYTQPMFTIEQKKRFDGMKEKFLNWFERNVVGDTK